MSLAFIMSCFTYEIYKGLQRLSLSDTSIKSVLVIL